MSKLYYFILTEKDAQMIEDLPNEVYGKIIRACVDFQFKGVEFPEPTDTVEKWVFSHFRKAIVRRENSRKGGIKNVENNGYKFYNEEHRRIANSEEESKEVDGEFAF